jgi:hypothetical protein
MRKGYRNTLMRQLRGKLSLGLNTFTLGAELLSVQSVVEAAEPDNDSDAAAEMRFAEDASGNGCVVNFDDGQVALIHSETGHRLNLGADLRGFVDALGPNQIPWH